ncbi:TPA: 50S ribosomal protein L9 [Candidatus Dependentiae bacterium]|nr:MAG: 50S ribosomal protein L9 [candidate division TM6 bacterium GW2011_GWE2_31_21]KKP53611.1 MAG: 50S ribosomal protein L9 [candidate division TM6 bacterium GW2011_GWF2_33_332]HBS48149.1 50S ribosomal protein L9 [Candidatus Dependentiae bacterium]HBZ73573.1 50S ribosomal protein L9 [Candidatus Dependentiae bacterium]
MLKVYLLKDVVNVGKEGQIKNVTEGYARNFLFPKKAAVLATANHVERVKEISHKIEVEESLAGSRIAMLADLLKKTTLVLKKKVNDKGKLYGSIDEDEIVTLLAARNISVNKKQIEITKSIRSVGEYTVIVKLSSKVKLEVKVVIEAASH